jgi:hypothetical protein
MELRERLTELLVNANVTPYEIYIKTGVNESVLSRVRNGVTKKLNIRNSELLANYFGVSREWLMNGVGPKESDKEKLFAISDVQNAIRPEKKVETSIDFAKLEWECARLVNENEKVHQEMLELKEAYVKQIQSMNEIIMLLNETNKKLEVDIAVLRYKEDMHVKVKGDTNMGEGTHLAQKTG